MIPVIPTILMQAAAIEREKAIANMLHEQKAKLLEAKKMAAEIKAKKAEVIAISNRQNKF